MVTGDELKNTRTYVLHLTQQELADKLGVSLRTVGNWEREGVPESREYIVTRAVGGALKKWRDTEIQLKETYEAPIYDESGFRFEGEPSVAEQDAQTRRDLEIARDVIEEDERAAIRKFSDKQLLQEIARRLERVSRKYAAENLELSLSPEDWPTS